MANDPMPWLILLGTAGLGPIGISKLIMRFKTPEMILSASQNQLLEISGIGPNLAKSILAHHSNSWAKKQVLKAKQGNISIVTLPDPQYPCHLRQIFAPPPVLFYMGDLDVCNNPTVAIVGSRAFTPYGRQTANQLSRDLAKKGITVVSGMAVGIDTHAHQGALDANGWTAAVLGSSLNRPYPFQNLALFRKICDEGVAISEFPLDTPPEAHNFPRRNRIISGVSLGTVVVEAGQRSGALITARYALEQNREVFAVPGPITSGRSVGPHRLIQQGAQLVSRTEDILEEIQLPENWTRRPSEIAKVDLDDQERALWECLSSDQSRQVNELARHVGSSTAATLNILLMLELKGYAHQLPGLNFQRRP